MYTCEALRGFGQGSGFWCNRSDAVSFFVKAVQSVLGVSQTGYWNGETQTAYMAHLRNVATQYMGSTEGLDEAIARFGATPEGMASDIIIAMVFPDDSTTFDRFGKPFMQALGIPTDSYEQCRRNIIDSATACPNNFNNLKAYIVQGLNDPTGGVQKAGFDWKWVLGIGALGVLGYFAFKGD